MHRVAGVDHSRDVIHVATFEGIRPEGVDVVGDGLESRSQLSRTPSPLEA